MALQRTKVTVTLDLLRHDQLTEDEAILGLKRRIAEAHGPEGSRSDERHGSRPTSK